MGDCRQRVKLASLNALGCLVTLRLHQFKYLERDSLPENLDSALVFDWNNISAIQDTILSLQDDKLQLKEQKRCLLACLLTFLREQLAQHLRSL